MRQAAVDLEGQHVHLEQTVARQVAVDVARHRAQVLPHHPGAAAVGLQRQDGEQLLGRIAHVDPLPLVDAAGDPEQPVELHDVVDAQDAGVRQVVAQHGAQVAVPLQPLALRVDGVEPPVLAAAEQRVGRRTGGSAGGEQVALAPGVERRRRDAERQVEVEPAAGVQRLGGGCHLLLGGELGVEMEAVDGAVEAVGIEPGAAIVAGAGPGVAEGRRPVLPAGAEALGAGAEGGIEVEVRPPLAQRGELGAARRRGVLGEERLGQRLEDAALEGGHAAVVDQLAGGQLGHLAPQLARSQELLRRRAARQLRQPPRIDEQLVPEQPAGRTVGRIAVRRLVVEGGEQRQGGDGAAAEAADPASELLETGEVADPEVAVAADRVDRQEDAPGALRRLVLAGVEAPGSDEQQAVAGRLCRRPPRRRSPRRAGGGSRAAGRAAAAGGAPAPARPGRRAPPPAAGGRGRGARRGSCRPRARGGTPPGRRRRRSAARRRRAGVPRRRTPARPGGGRGGRGVRPAPPARRPRLPAARPAPAARRPAPPSTRCAGRR